MGDECHRVGSTPAPKWLARGSWRYHLRMFWYRLHKWAVATLPGWMLGLIITVFTTFFFLTIFNIRRAIGSNLVPVLGPCGFLVRQRRIYKTMWSFAWCLSERYERLATSRSFSVDVEAIEHWRKANAAGGGVVMVTAHLGMYEAGSMLPAAERTAASTRAGARVDPRARSSSGGVSAVEGAHFTVHFQGDDPSMAWRCWRGSAGRGRRHSG